ncbi:MAG: hypothetical protein OEZ14_16380, partial [Acidimicrobiia bacterium]|nr:hypothetical protein [Acidimicrobiia bacterium]
APTKTPNQAARPTRRSTTNLEPRHEVAQVGTTSGPTRSEVGEVGHRQSFRREPTPNRLSLTPITARAATRNSTLLFRALLLIAAAVALAFTVAAWIAPPNPGADNSTSPDAPPPAVFVQPDR